MGTLPLLRRGLTGSALLALLVSAPALADELPAGCRAAGLVIHGPQETLLDFCRREDGLLWLCLPDGARFELVTSTEDPCIANPGDGAFHPFDESVVRDALAGVRYPLTGISAQVFLLPYPRRFGLESAAGGGLVLLSPGVRPLSPERQHAEFVHELGHVVQYGLMPDAAMDLWSRYRDLRGIEDEGHYSPDAPHADRPHEIFAEDFRALFGGFLANYAGTIENSALCMPQAVPGLDGFMLGLAGVSLEVGRLEVHPNPSRGPLTFRRAGGEAAILDLFDLAGRRIRMLAPVVESEGWVWRWDGLDERGDRVQPGILFARIRGAVGPGMKVTVAR